MRLITAMGLALLVIMANLARAQTTTACRLNSTTNGTQAFTCSGIQVVKPFLSRVTAAAWPSASPSPPPLAPNGTVFYLDPVHGSDTADGKTAPTAWATADHPIPCGASLLLQVGRYGGVPFQAGRWGANSACPGPNGEMYRIVQCAGSNLQDCTIDGQIDGSESALDVSSDNWMIKGVTITNLSPGAAHSYCLQATGNHIAFVNVYVHDCSWSASATTKDHVAWIGVLLFRAATSTAASGGGCPSNLSDITPLAVDKNAGTHKFYKGFLSMRAHLGANCIDGHGLIFDSWAMHAYVSRQ